MSEADTKYRDQIKPKLRYRNTTPQDSLAVWQLVQDSGTLEANTAYFYLIFCSDFAQTCLIAEFDDEVVGVVIGYHPPTEPATAFCWQIGVHPDWRGQGVASELLRHWLNQPANQTVRWLTATVAVDNPASDRLFRRFAQKHHCPCEVREHFTASLLAPGNAPEPLYRIGPLNHALLQHC